MKVGQAGKITELSLTEVGGLFYAKRLKERHHELLRKLKQQYGKPKKSVKVARKAWKDNTRASAPTHSAYAAINASASLYTFHFIFYTYFKGDKEIFINGS